MDTTSFLSKVKITPTTDFTAGTSVDVQLTVGNQFSTVASSLPSNVNESPVSFGIELKIKNPDQAAQVVDTLTQLKDMAIAMVPNAEEFLKQGVSVNFRPSGSSVFIDVSLSGAYGEKITSVLSKYNFSSVNFTGGSNLTVSSKLSPVDILSYNLGQLLDEVSNLKFEYNGEFSHLKNIVSFATDTLTAVTQGNLPQKLKPAVYAMRFAEVVRKLDFNFQYDSSTVHEIIKDTVNSASGVAQGEKSKYEKLAESWTSERQPQAQEIVSQVSEMGSSFLEPYKPALLNLNLDNLTVYAVCPSVKAYAKVGLNIRGASDFVAKTLG